MHWRLALLLALLLARTSLAEHRPGIEWMQGMRGKDGQSCCGMLDCQEATVAVLEEHGMETTVLIGETLLTLPSLWVHPSQDPQGRGWICFVHDTRPGNLYQDAEGHMRAIPPATYTRDNVRCVFHIGLN